MNREEKIQDMVQNYIHKRDQLQPISVMEFHQNRLLLFLNRFHQLTAHYSTPSSSLLSNDIFLIIEAATIVAKSDFIKCGENDKKRNQCFLKYFDAFNRLSAGIEPLDEGVAMCVNSLTEREQDF